MNGTGRMLCIVVGLVVTVAVTTATAQVTRSSIIGTVKDESGGVLPGVSVTIKSPALQVPQMETVSDTDGTYAFLDLPNGTYQATFQLPGFSTVIREQIQLTTDFAARIDPVMTVGALAETVTVSGQSPVVDTTTTRGGGNMSADLIQALPVNKNHQDMMLLVPGAQVIGPPMTAAIGLRAVPTGTLTYGLPGQSTIRFDGLDVSAAGEYPDFSTGEEVDVKTYGGTAETHTAGVNVNIIIKAGGNEFHGRVEEQALHHRFNSTNVDGELRAQGISAGDALQYDYDTSFQLGGRIVRDKLWFYGSYRDQHMSRTIVGYSDAPGPDGRYGTLDDVVGEQPGFQINRTLKLSYQATPKHKFVGLVGRMSTEEPHTQGNRFIPAESTIPLGLYSRPLKFEWQGAFTNRLLANVLVGDGGYLAVYGIPEMWGGGQPPPEGYSITNVPRISGVHRLDRATGYQTGPNFASTANSSRGPDREQLIGKFTWAPERSLAGSHTLQFGGDIYWGSFTTRYPSYAGDIQLVYDTIGGRPLTPVQINIKDLPLDGPSAQIYSSAYVSDEWRLHPRLTANVGLRWERQRHYLPEQEKFASPNFPSLSTPGTFSEVDLVTWKQFAPRLGVAFDLSGDGKTVLKGTYGLFYEDLGTAFGGAYNPNGSPTTYTYRWSDQDGDNNYTPGEVNLSLTGPDFVTFAGPRATFVEPGLKSPSIDQASASIEHELVPGVAVRGLYVYVRRSNQIATVNLLRPYSAYDVPITRRDPGPDGVLSTADDGGLITLYDYSAAFAGANFVRNVTVNSDRQDTYNNLEVSVTKRRTAKWSASASFVATKNHARVIVVPPIVVPQSPNDDVNAINDTWDRIGRGAVSYLLPLQINVSAVYQVFSGVARQRTNVFRATDPSGPRLPQSISITQRMEPMGAIRGPVRDLINIRTSKGFRIGSRGNLEVGVDALNAFNTNVPWGGNTASNGWNGFNELSGPAYNYVLRIPEPRALRFSAAFDF